MKIKLWLTFCQLDEVPYVNNSGEGMFILNHDFSRYNRKSDVSIVF